MTCTHCQWVIYSLKRKLKLLNFKTLRLKVACSSRSPNRYDRNQNSLLIRKKFVFFLNKKNSIPVDPGTCAASCTNCKFNNHKISHSNYVSWNRRSLFFSLIKRNRLSGKRDENSISCMCVHQLTWSPGRGTL